MRTIGCAAGLAGLWLATVLLSGLASAGAVQDLVDAAAPGSTVRIPAGQYEDSVVVAKPLALVGEPETVIAATTGPALTIQGDGVRIEEVFLVGGTEEALVIRDAGSVALKNVRLEGTARATNVGWVRIIVPPDEAPFATALDNAGALHGHPVTVTVTYENGAPWSGARVRFNDGDVVTFEGTTNEAGRVGPVPVIDGFRRAGPGGTDPVSGQNQTTVTIEGTSQSFGIDPHGGALAFQTTVAQPIVDGFESEEPVPVAVVAGAVAVMSVALLGAAFAFHEGFRWKWLAFLAPLYTRLSRQEVLEHGTREAIYGHVEANPGVHLRALKRDLSLQHGTLLHHLGMLESQQYVRSVRDGMYRRYYAVGKAPIVEPADDLAARIEAAIRERPGATNAAIAAVLSKRPSLVHYHVERLVEVGRVQKEHHGREVRLHPVEDASNA